MADNSSDIVYLRVERKKKKLPWCVFGIEIGGRKSGNFCDGYEVTIQIKVMVSKYIHHLLNFMNL